MDRLGSMEAFVMAAELGSFTLAAKRLRISASALSRRVAHLEEQLRAASSIAAYVHGCKLDRGMASTVAPPSSPGRAPRTTHAPRHSTSVHASSVKGSHASASAPHRLAAKIALTPVTAPARVKAVRSLPISYALRAARRFFVESRRILHTSRQHVLDP